MLDTGLKVLGAERIWLMRKRNGPHSFWMRDPTFG